MTAEAGVIMPKRPSTCAGALQQVVANDPLAQRLVSALEPTFGPIVQYAAKTPFFSNIITAVASSNDPVVSMPYPSRYCCAKVIKLVQINIDSANHSQTLWAVLEMSL